MMAPGNCIVHSLGPDSFVLDFWYCNSSANSSLADGYGSEYALLSEPVDEFGWPLAGHA